MVIKCPYAYKDIILVSFSPAWFFFCLFVTEKLTFHGIIGSELVLLKKILYE